ALVTGRHAFAEESDVFRLIQAMRDEGAEAPSKHAPQPIPLGLDIVILKALAWNAADRFQSAAAFAESLRTITEPPKARRAIAEPPEEPDEPTRALAPEQGLPRWAFVLIAAVSGAAAFVALALAGGMR